MFRSLETLNLIFDAPLQYTNNFCNILITCDLDNNALFELLKEKNSERLTFKFDQNNIFDLSNFTTAGELAAVFTTLTETDVIFIRYAKPKKKILKNILIDIFEERKLMLTIGSNEKAHEVQIDIPNFTLVLIVETSLSVDSDIANLFPLRVELKSQKQIEKPRIESNFSKNLKRNSETELNSEMIYSWRDSQREPNILNDIENVIASFDGENLFSTSRAYIDYICTHYNLHEDVERDTCEILVRKDGIYKDLLLEAFLGWEGGEDQLADFEENGVSVSSFFDYANTYKNIQFKRILLFRYLKCFELLPMQYELNNSNPKKFEKLLTDSLIIPKNFDSNFKNILSDLFKKTCSVISEL